jgi:hypothetical protein
MIEEATERIDTGWTIEGNFSYFRDGTDLLSALYLQDIIAKDKNIESRRCTLVIDIDQILAKTASEQVSLEISYKQLEQLRLFLQEHPETSVIIITSRHSEYGWGKAEEWVLNILNVLNTDLTYDYETMLHSLAYDTYSHLYECIEKQNGPTRLLITGAAKTKAARTLETSIGHRSIFNFLLYDVLNIFQFVVKTRLFRALQTIFQNQIQRGGGMVTIIDDGAMYPVVAEIAPSVENTETIYLHINEETRIGNPSKLIRGLLGILAYTIRNGRKLTKTVNP